MSSKCKCNKCVERRRKYEKECSRERDSQYYHLCSQSCHESSNYHNKCNDVVQGQQVHKVHKE